MPPGAAPTDRRPLTDGRTATRSGQELERDLEIRNTRRGREQNAYLTL